MTSRLLIITWSCLAIGGLQTSRVQQATMHDALKADSPGTRQVSKETVDLTPFLKGKALKDGTHFLTTSPAGVRISVVTKGGKVGAVLFTGLDGKERSGSPRVHTIAARKKGEETTCTVTNCTTGSKTVTTTGGGKTTTRTTTTTTCTTQPCDTSTGGEPRHVRGKFDDRK